MPKKPIYEAFSSLNQIKSKYLKESKSLKDLKITFQQLEKLVNECDPMESGSKTAYNKVIKKLDTDYNISKEDAKELLKSIYSWEEGLKESRRNNIKLRVGRPVHYDGADYIEIFTDDPKDSTKSTANYIINLLDRRVDMMGPGKFWVYASPEELDDIKNLIETTEQETITEERRPPYSDDEMEKYYDMLDESREYQKELRKLDRGIDISRDENDKFGVNWPARGTQSVEEVEKFVYALDQAAQFCRELNTKYADIL